MRDTWTHLSAHGLHSSSSVFTTEWCSQESTSACYWNTLDLTLLLETQNTINGRLIDAIELNNQLDEAE